MSKNLLTHIKDSLNQESVLRFLRQHDFRLNTNSDSSLRGSCPIHKGDNTSAFVWNLDNNLWYCHTGCGKGGDIFEFVADYYEIDPKQEFKKIVYKTAELLGIDTNGFNMNVEYNSRQDIEQWLKFVNKESDELPLYDMNILGELKIPTSYRDFNSDTIERFSLSYSPSLNAMVIPLTQNGNIVGVNLRNFTPGEKKYKLIPKNLKAGHILYNFDKIVQGEDTVILTEGCSDVWNLHQLGINNATSSLGSHLAEGQEKILLKHFTNIHIMYDGDVVGRRETIKLIDKLQHKANVMVYDLPDGIDPGSLESLEGIVPIQAYLFTQKYNEKGEMRNG